MKAAILALTLAAAPALAAEPWEGVWAAEPGWCANAGQIGTADPAPIGLSRARGFEGLENGCTLDTVEPLGVGNAWRFGMTCTSEGMTYQDHMLVMVDAGDRLLTWHAEGFLVSRTRCR